METATVTLVHVAFGWIASTLGASRAAHDDELDGAVAIEWDAEMMDAEPADRPGELCGAVVRTSPDEAHEESV